MDESKRPAPDPTMDPREVERFGALAAEWWDPNGRFRPLHALNPVRLTYIRDHLCRRFGRDARDGGSFGETEGSDATDDSIRSQTCSGGSTSSKSDSSPCDKTLRIRAVTAPP